MAVAKNVCPLCGCPAEGDRCRDHRVKAEAQKGRVTARLVPEE